MENSNNNHQLHRRCPITNPEEVMAEGGGERERKSSIIKIKLMLSRRESSDFSLFSPPESSFAAIPRRAFFLFRSIFRRVASVAHPSTNRRGGVLSRRRVNGNGKASGVIFDFSPRPRRAVNQHPALARAILLKFI